MFMYEVGRGKGRKAMKVKFSLQRERVLSSPLLLMHFDNVLAI